MKPNYPNLKLFWVIEMKISNVIVSITQINLQVG